MDRDAAFLEEIDRAADAAVSKGLAIEQLARVLYETMERLDPGIDEAPSWDRLLPRDREFYGYCISALLARRGLLKAATDDNVVTRHSGHRE